MNIRQAPKAFGWVMIAEAATFAFGSLSHIPVTIGPLSEPRIVPAAIVEAICAAALTAGGVTVLRDSRRSWDAAVAAHVTAALGVLLGIVALAAGRGPRTASNDVFHALILTALVIGLGILLQEGKTRKNGPEAA